MLTVVIKDNGESSVTKFTYDHLWRELKDIPGSQLLVEQNWFDGLLNIKNHYICFVEPDCLVNSGYFTSQLRLFKKASKQNGASASNKTAVMSASTAVINWANKIFGYAFQIENTDGIVPNRDKKSRYVYPVQLAYIPGAIVRVSMLNQLLENGVIDIAEEDIVLLSAQMSLGFWRQGDGNRVYINPNATYVTTEAYINDIKHLELDVEDLLGMFKKESI